MDPKHLVLRGELSGSPALPPVGLYGLRGAAGASVGPQVGDRLPGAHRPWGCGEAAGSALGPRAGAPGEGASNC